MKWTVAGRPFYLYGPTSYNLKMRKYISENEAHCHCGCGGYQSDFFLDLVNDLRTVCRFPLKFTSMYRCRIYNEKVGGVKFSPHLLLGEFGAVDIGLSDPVKRYIVFKYASILGFNQFEVCNNHIHIAIVPNNHCLAYALHWGISK